MESPKFPEITSFLEIINYVNKNTLVVLDIDETILRYNGINSDYWHNLFSINYYLLKDYDKADEKTTKDWISLVENSKPKHTDFEGLTSLISKIEECGAKLIYLTARTYNMKSETSLHFEELGLSKNSKIFYDGDNKGERLKGILELDKKLKKNNIIFIDDLHTNLCSVKQTFNNKVQCFKFIINS